MKGYYTANGYMGLVEGKYILFVCEEEYREYLAQLPVIDNKKGDLLYFEVVACVRRENT